MKLRGKEDPMAAQWPPVEYEERPWSIDPEERALIPRSRRRKITSSYRAAVPASIAGLKPHVPESLLRRSAEIANALSRFDGEQRARGFELPALMLRSESSASSQIENLTSSVRNVALAEISDDAPHNALVIAGNVAAMRTALELPGELSVSGICAVHETLMQGAGESFAGKLRDEQVWIGGTPYSPHGAQFVPPAPERVESLLEDLIGFSARDDLDPIVQTAIAHAQFETIHPFIDGNGRTGRAILHKQLSSSGILSSSTLPISSGLLHDLDGYLAALDAYHEGDIESIVGVLCSALETALRLGTRALGEIDRVLEGWEAAITERAGSKIHELPALLVEQPVVNAPYVAEHLGITERAARDLLDRARDHGIVEQAGNQRRGRFYQATGLIGILEELVSEPGIRRTLAS